MKKVAIALALVFCAAVSACGSMHLGVRQEEMNVDAYDSPRNFVRYHTSGIQKGISEDALFALIHGTGLKQIARADEIQQILFGGANPLADKESLPGISSWILSHHILILPYRNTRTEFYFSTIPISYTVEEYGPDLSVVFITKRDELKDDSPYVLVKTMVTGVENRNTKTKEYIWVGIWNALSAVKQKLF